ncbi:MAG: hypothetical protein JW943_07915 [Deltaproteobacteria bacterium]|nr:hypothetical protein [Deltaproteobacteria bacterium]
MTVRDLIEEDGGKLGITRICAAPSGLMTELTGARVRIATGVRGLSQSPAARVPLIIAKSCRRQLKTSLHVNGHVIFQTLKTAGIPFLALAEMRAMPHDLARFAIRYNIPIFGSIYDEHLLASRILGLLREKIDHIATLCGTLVDCAGVGVLMSGDSDVGKTRCAVRLVERGHCFVADDCVEIEKKQDNRLYGRPHPLTAGLLELKPVGIVKASDVFGALSVCPETVVDMNVEFASDAGNEEDDGAMPFGDRKIIMGVELPFIRLSGLHDVGRMADAVGYFAGEYAKKGRES